MPKNRHMKADRSVDRGVSKKNSDSSHGYRGNDVNAIYNKIDRKFEQRLKPQERYGDVGC